MKKVILALSVLFAVQIVALCCLALPPKEPVQWAQNEYGRYEIADCQYGEETLNTIRNTISDYEKAQSEKYKADERQIVLTAPSRILYNRNSVTVVEYCTERKTYTSAEAGFLMNYELFDTVQLWIVADGNGANVSLKPTDCNAAAFVNEKTIQFDASLQR